MNMRVRQIVNSTSTNSNLIDEGLHMKLVEINWNPTNRQLRQFALICLFALPLVGWFWGLGLVVIAWLAGVGLVLALAGIAVPKAIKPVFLALTILAAPIGLAAGEVAMLFIYFAVFVPIGVFFRLSKRDALQMNPDRERTTYWQPKKQPTSVADYYRQS